MGSSEFSYGSFPESEPKYSVPRPLSTSPTPLKARSNSLPLLDSYADSEPTYWNLSDMSLKEEDEPKKSRHSSESSGVNQVVSSTMKKKKRRKSGHKNTSNRQLSNYEVELVKKSDTPLKPELVNVIDKIISKNWNNFLQDRDSPSVDTQIEKESKAEVQQTQLPIKSRTKSIDSFVADIDPYSKREIPPAEQNIYQDVSEFKKAHDISIEEKQ